MPVSTLRLLSVRCSARSSISLPPTSCLFGSARCSSSQVLLWVICCLPRWVISSSGACIRLHSLALPRLVARCWSLRSRSPQSVGEGWIRAEASMISALLTQLTLLLCGCLFVRLFTYRRAGANFRRGVSIVATLVMGCAGAAVIYIAQGKLVVQVYEWPLVFMLF